MVHIRQLWAKAGDGERAVRRRAGHPDSVRFGMVSEPFRNLALEPFRDHRIWRGQGVVKERESVLNL